MRRPPVARSSPSTYGRAGQQPCLSEHRDRMRVGKPPGRVEHLGLSRRRRPDEQEPERGAGHPVGHDGGEQQLDDARIGQVQHLTEHGQDPFEVDRFQQRGHAHSATSKSRPQPEQCPFIPADPANMRPQWGHERNSFSDGVSGSTSWASGRWRTGRLVEGGRIPAVRREGMPRLRRRTTSLQAGPHQRRRVRSSTAPRPSSAWRHSLPAAQRTGSPPSSVAAETKRRNVFSVGEAPFSTLWTVCRYRPARRAISAPDIRDASASRPARPPDGNTTGSSSGLSPASSPERPTGSTRAGCERTGST